MHDQLMYNIYNLNKEFQKQNELKNFEKKLCQGKYAGSIPRPPYEHCASHRSIVPLPQNKLILILVEKKLVH